MEIPLPEMPSLESHKAASAQWLSRIKPLLYENWPDTLKELSFKTDMVELSLAEQMQILEAFDGKGDLTPIKNRLDEAIKSPVFSRLSSRSPKDAWTETFKCNNGGEVLNLFTQSERILDDLIEYKYADIPCYLLLREWHDIPKKEEWRCFIRGGKFIGASQYFYNEEFENIHAYGLTKTVNAIIPILPIDTVVLDIWLKEKPMVIEINPYGLSDPCLFTYKELETAMGDIKIKQLNPTNRGK